MALDLDCGVVDHLLIACPVQRPCWVQAVCLRLGPGKFFPMAEWSILQFPSPGSCSQKPLGDEGERGHRVPASRLLPSESAVSAACLWESGTLRLWALTVLNLLVATCEAMQESSARSRPVDAGRRGGEKQPSRGQRPRQSTGASG